MNPLCWRATDPVDRPGNHPLRRLNFSESDQQALNYQRYHHPHPRVQPRMEALGLKSQGVPPHQMARLCRLRGNPLRADLKRDQAGGVEALKPVAFHRPQSALQAHRETIKAHLRDHPPQTSNEAVTVLDTLTGIRRRPTQVRVFLQQLGRTCLKGGGCRPTLTHSSKRRLQKKLEPRVAEAPAGEGAVFVVDAAPFVFGALLGYRGCFARGWSKAPSGRQRFQVLGALKAIPHEIITGTTLTDLHSESVCQWLYPLVEVGVQVPMTLVLDKARYHRCALVQAVADTLGIALRYLPAYSPNLNWSERLWTLVKKPWLSSQYYADFTAFTQAIEAGLAATQTTHKPALRSLLTFTFQAFKKAQSLTV